MRERRGPKGMKEANETGLGFELWGHLHPREPRFKSVA